MAVYFFYGDEDYNIDLELEKMRSKLNPDFLSMSYRTIDNPIFTNLITALRTPPMMFGDTLIVIDVYKCFFKVDNSEIVYNDSELSEIDEALSNNTDGLNIVFVLRLSRTDGKSIDKRRKFYKIISKYNTKEFQPYKSYNISEITSFIKSRAKAKDIKIDSDAVTLLIEQIGVSLLQFDNELDKLKLIAYPEKTITRDMVEKISISNQDLFNFTDFIMTGKKDCALLEFKKLLDKKHPLELLSAIQTMLRKWIILKTKSSSTSTAELSKMVGMHEFVVKQNLQKLKNTPVAELVKLKENLLDVEYKIKSAESVDMVSEVECAIIR